MGVLGVRVERAIASVCWAYKRAAGGNRLGTDAARMVLTTHKSDRAKRPGTRQRRAAPATVGELRTIVATLDADTPHGARDRAVLVLGFAMGARRSEIAALDIADLTFTDDQLEVLVRDSKTDKQHEGRVTIVVYGSDPDTCPVRTVRAWLTVLAEHGRTSGPLFMPIDRHGNIGRTVNGRERHITGQSIATIVNRAARAANLDPSALWSGHSLRRGFATAAYSNEADPLRIARHAGWIDNSRALSRYIEDVDRRTKNPLIGIGL
jgi:integrase